MALTEIRTDRALLPRLRRAARRCASRRRRRRGAARVCRPDASWSPRPTRWWRACTFRRHSPPASIGHRALAVNLSDLAAMGARPAWALLALTLPEADEAWLDGVRRGPRRAGARSTTSRWSAATRRAVRCASPCSCSGYVPRATALTRSGARARATCCSCPARRGDAAAGLAHRAGGGSRHRRRAARLSARALPLSDAARRARRSAARLRERLHRRLRRPARRMPASWRRRAGGGGARMRAQLPVSEPLARRSATSSARASSRSPAVTTTSCASPCRRHNVGRAARAAAAAALGLHAHRRAARGAAAPWCCAPVL